MENNTAVTTTVETAPKLILPEFETLISGAWTRLKERFVSLILISLISFGLGIAFFCALLPIAGMAGVFGFGLQLVPLAVVIAVVGFIAALAAAIYFGLWIQLSLIWTVLSPTKVEIGGAFSYTRSFIIKYLIFSLLMGLFMIGIFPLGFFTFFIIPILWSIWAIFAPFYLLTHPDSSGLGPLWASRDMFKGVFWGVLGRILLLWLIVGGVSWMVSFIPTFLSPIFSAFGDQSAIIFVMGALLAIVGNLASAVVSIAASFFSYCYLAELYTAIPAPQKGKSSTAWLIVSAIGFMVTLLTVITVTSVIAMTAPRVWPEVRDAFMEGFNEEMYKDKKPLIDDNLMMPPNGDYEFEYRLPQDEESTPDGYMIPEDKSTIKLDITPPPVQNGKNSFNF